MKVILLTEGQTETALKEHLKRFLDGRAEAEKRPKLSLVTKNIITLDEHRLRRRIQLELGQPDVAAVVGLVDVYPYFRSADEAKQFLRRVAEHNERFHAHAAQYEVEAWLLPYWEHICRRLGVRRAAPSAQPERVDLDRPPSHHLTELYRQAKPPRKYNKTLEMAALLRGQDLAIAAGQCPEFKALLNTLLALNNLKPLD